MEDLILQYWMNELREELTGGRLQKIRSSDCQIISLDFGRSHGNLVFCLKPWRLFACLRSSPFIHHNPKGDQKIFCLMLEKALQGMVLKEVDKIPEDRILSLRFGIGQDSRILVIEFIPAFPNLFLLDGNRKIQGLFNFSRASRRDLGIGVEWKPPRLSAAVQSEEQVIRPSVQPALFSVSPPEQSDWRKIDPWRDFEMCLSPPAASKPGVKTDCQNVNQLLCLFSKSAEEYLLFESRKKESLFEMEKEIRRLERAIKGTESDLPAIQDPEGLRRKGELLLAHFWELKKNWEFPAETDSETRVWVPNHYENDMPLTAIPVNPLKSAQANANAYFHMARKAERGKEFVQNRLSILKRNLAFQQAQRDKISAATSLSDLPDLKKSHQKERSEVKGGEAEKSPTIRRREKIPGCKAFVSHDGFIILVGQSAKHNENLTFRVAGEYDLWLHAADYAGSHVVIRNPEKKSVSQDTLREAARLAAYYSSARSQRNAEVRFTEKRFVQKVKGGGLGLVRLQKFRTISVPPGTLHEKTAPDCTQVDRL